MNNEKDNQSIHLCHLRTVIRSIHRINRMRIVRNRFLQTTLQHHRMVRWNGCTIHDNYDARGKDSPANKHVIKVLSDKGFLNELAFARIESWKGGFYFFTVYKDAPDILVTYNGTDVEYRTVEQFDLYSYGDDTIIKTGISSRYGYGTRSSIMAFIDGIRRYKASAVAQQGNVPVQKRGKLLYDLLNLNELKQLFS